MRAIREAEWSGLAAADRQGRRRTPPAALAGLTRAAGLRRYAGDRRARPRPLLGADRHEVVAVVTRPDAPAGRGRQPGRRAGDGRALEARASRCSHPPGRASRSSSTGCARSRPTAARSSPTARWCRRPRSTSRATAGSTCTSRCCPPGAARRPCSTPSSPATRSPARRPSGSRRGWTPGRCSATVTEEIRPDRDRAATCWTGSPAPAPGCSSPPSTASRTAPSPPCRSRPTASRWPQGRRRRRPGRLDRTGPARRPAGPRVHPGPGRVDDVPRPPGQARTGAAGRPDRRSRPGRLQVTRDATGESVWAAPAAPGAAGRGPAGGQAGDGRRGLGARRAPRPAATGVRSEPPPRPAPRVRPTRAGAGRLRRRPARSRRAGRLRQPAPAADAARERGWSAATRRSRPSSPTARCAGRASSTRSSPRPPAGRWPRSTRRCATRCGSGPTSCCALRVPAHAAVDATVELVRATAGERAVGFATRCCAGSPATDLDAWVRRAGRRTTRSARWRSGTATRGGSPPPWRRRCSAATAGARRRRCADGPAGDPPRGPARPDLAGEALLAQCGGQAEPGPWSPYAVRLAGGRPGGHRRGPGRDGRRPGRGQPARRTRAGPRTPSTAPTAAGSTCAPAPAGRPRCWPARSRRAAGCSPTTSSRTGPGSSPGRPRAARAGRRLPTAPDRRGGRPRSTGVLRRRALHRAGSAAPPPRGRGGAARPADVARLHAAAGRLLARAARRRAARWPRRLRHLLAAPRGDPERGRRGAAPARPQDERSTPGPPSGTCPGSARARTSSCGRTVHGTDAMYLALVRCGGSEGRLGL